MNVRSARFVCPLCEAACGLLVGVGPDGTVEDVRGDRGDVFSQGYICPKGVAVKSLHTDPDRLLTPMVRVDGRLREVSWDEAWAELGRRLPPLIGVYGPDAVGVYGGSGSMHRLDARLYLPALVESLGTRTVFSATGSELAPKLAVANLLYGSPQLIPVPDVDRTDHLVLLGADPVTSHGGLLTAPDLRGRLRALRRRGGRLVVVDPRRSATADGADEHLRIRPGTDPVLLLGLIHVLVDEGLTDLGALPVPTRGLADVAELAADFTPDRVARRTRLDSHAIRSLARDLAAAPRAAVHAGAGALANGSGTVTSWLVEVLNALTGNLDRAGGAMFPLPAHARLGGHGTLLLGEDNDGPGGDLPAATLAAHMDSPEFDRLRALIVVGGNPARSLPNSPRWRAARTRLDLMVSVDYYLNETSALADIVLPVPSPLERAQYDLDRYALAVRNTAAYSPAVLPLPLGMHEEWETLARIALVAKGAPAADDLAEFDDAVALRLAERLGAPPEALSPGMAGPERMLDLLLQAGPYGLRLEDLLFSPQGLDFGELEPALAERLGDHKVDLAPPALLRQGHEIRADLDTDDAPMLVLVRRGHLRSNNTWLHNLPAMVSGARRCTVQVHPDDAHRLGLRDGGLAKVIAAVGHVVAAVQVTEEVSLGTVSLPHGWGHDEPQARLRIAAARPGVDYNRLTNDGVLDPITGAAKSNAVPVRLMAHTGDAPETEAPPPQRHTGLDRRRTPRPPVAETFGPY
ncbi:MAG: molybdopterin-dependent oxidoreductase [Sporichthyaceae bacterium]